MAKDRDKYRYEEDKFMKLVRKIEGFIVTNIKLIIISVIIIGIGVGAYFSIDYLINKKREMADGSFGIVYIKYRAIINNGSLKEEEKNRKLEEVLKDFQQVEREFPGTIAFSRSAFFAGNILYSLGKVEQAAIEFNNGYTKGKGRYIKVLCMYNEAICYEQLEKYDKAKAILKKIIDEYPKSYLIPTVKYELGQIYEYKNNLQMAKSEYKDIIDKFNWSNWKDLAKKRIILVENFQ